MTAQTPEAPRTALEERETFLEAVCWRREWDGDVSDLGRYVHADSAEELDNIGPWEALYAEDDVKRIERSLQQSAERIATLEAALSRCGAELSVYQSFYEGVAECFGDTWQCRCGNAEDWWIESNADYATRDARTAIAVIAARTALEGR